MPRLLRPGVRRPHRHDVLIALAGLAGGLAMWALGLRGGPGLPGVPPWCAGVALAVMTGAELLRRTAPRYALGVATAALALDTLAGTLLATVVMFTDVLYAAVVYGGPRLAWRLPRLSVLLTLVATLGPVTVWREPELLLIGVAAGLVTIGPAFTGLIVRHHRDEAAAERLRAEQTALLAEVDRVQAVTAERARMARELHDLVANHLSAIAIHATAAQSLGGDAAATREALGVIRENSVQGLTEMRRLIGILRDPADAPEPAATPTLDGLDALLDRARAAATDGFPFTLLDRRCDGPLSAPVELAAYRVVQESVTNALKHAAPGEVTVDVRGGEVLTVRVTSPLGGGSGGAGPRVPGSGAGLVGMRERVELLGGSLTAGPALATGSADGTGGAAGAEGAGSTEVWEVRAELPTGEGTQR